MSLLYNLISNLKTDSERLAALDSVAAHDCARAADVLRDVSEDRRGRDLISRRAAIVALREGKNPWNDDLNLSIERAVKVIEGLEGVGDGEG